MLGLVAATGWLVRDASARGPKRPPLAAAMPRPALPTPKVEEAAPPAPERRATIAFVGDVAMTLGIAARLRGGNAPPGFPFAAVAPRLRLYDFAIGNLECVVSDKGRAVIPEPLAAPLDAPMRLLDAGFDAVSVANNHALDLSAEGYFDMLRRLDAAGLPHFGVTSADATSREPFIVRDVRGLRLALIGHVDRGTARGLADVARARKMADVVIVFVHWGVEYDLYPTVYQRRQSRALIDAGADAVIASHTHVVQPAELHHGKLIAHGLGNFVFSSMTRRGTHTGALVELDLGPSGVTGHRFRRVAIDARGVPEIASEASEEPFLDPPEPRPLPPM